MWKRVVFLFLLLLASKVQADPVAAPAETLYRIAFGSCLKQNRPQPVWSAVRKTEPQLFVFMGDNVYADTENPLVLRAAYDRLNSNPAFQQFRSSVPIVATWDDHDYGENDAGADFPAKEISQDIFLDFFNVPADSPRRRQKGVYSSAIYGPPGRRVQVILLDTRYFRSPLQIDERKLFPPRPYLPNTDFSATLLGRAQWNWLRDELKRPAEIRLIVTSIQMIASDYPREKWANFPLEKKKLFETLRETGATGVLFLSGDRHFAEISREEADGISYTLYDVTASSLNDAEKPGFSDRNTRRVDAPYGGNNFGLLEIDWDNASPRISVEIRDEEGHIRLQHDIPFAELLIPHGQ
jgi:alkaline phosphatase D